MRIFGVALVCLALLVGSARAGDGPFRYRDVGHIGGRGSGLGLFPGYDSAGPSGVAVDQVCGEVYIADQGARVVHRYDQYGKPLLDIGVPGSEVRGGLTDPTGIFVDNAGFSASNPLGPPPACAKEGTLWVADYGGTRIDAFAPDGGVKGVWCGREFPAGICDIASRPTFDYYPSDVWVTGERVWVTGRLGNTISEYTLDGKLVRESPSTGGAYSVAQWGTQLWSTYRDHAYQTVALWSADPTVGLQIPLVHEFPYDGTFTGASGLWTGIDSTLYVVDKAGLQVYSASGILRSTTPLSFGAVDVAARYDGTVYVTGGHISGAEVFSPGATVTLKKLPGRKHEIVLAGSVHPGSPKSPIVIQRAEGNGWHTLATQRLDRKSKFVYHWTPPQKRVHYRVRLDWHDPRSYYANRESAILDVASR